MAKWFVYIIKCSDDTLYCGIAKDVEERVKKHNIGIGAKYTQVRIPVELVYFEEYENHREAAQREYQIKKWRRAMKINLIRSKNPEFKLKKAAE